MSGISLFQGSKSAREGGGNHVEHDRIKRTKTSAISTADLPGTSEQRAPLEKLPEDMLSHILSFLPQPSVLKAMHEVCKAWCQIPPSVVLNLSQEKNMTDSRLKSIIESMQAKRYLITSIDLSGCTKITDRGLEVLKGMPLIQLSLRGCARITDVGLGELKGMPLTALVLAGCTQITDVGLERLKEMLLTRLALAGCARITDVGLGVLKGMPFTHLNLDGCTQITDVGLGVLKGMPLTILKLHGCTQITDVGLGVLKGTPCTHLSLLGCTQITDVGLGMLKGMPLTELSLNGCTQITDVGLRVLIGMPLTHLGLGRTQITDIGLGVLKGMLLNLLNLAECTQITDVGLEALQDMPLTRLNLKRCTKIAPMAVQVFREAFPTALLTVSLSTDIAKQRLMEETLAKLGKRFSNKVDRFVYRLARSRGGVERLDIPHKFGDLWGKLNRYIDIGRLKAALILAAAPSIHRGVVKASMAVLDLVQGDFFTLEQMIGINYFLDQMPSEQRNRVDFFVYEAAPQPKGGDRWGAEHRYDDVFRFRRAVYQMLEEKLWPHLSTLRTGSKRPNLTVVY